MQPGRHCGQAKRDPESMAFPGVLLLPEWHDGDILIAN
jgi:hypothetical protein